MCNRLRLNIKLMVNLRILLILSCYFEGNKFCMHFNELLKAEYSLQSCNSECLVLMNFNKSVNMQF